MKDEKHSIGLDLFKKEKLKRELMNANQIRIQLQALEKLNETKMTSVELKEYIESLGGDYYLLLPILKSTGLLVVGAEDNGKRGRQFVYSLNKGF